MWCERERVCATGDVDLIMTNDAPVPRHKIGTGGATRLRRKRSVRSFVVERANDDDVPRLAANRQLTWIRLERTCNRIYRQSSLYQEYCAITPC